MQKITLKYEYGDDHFIPQTYTMEFDSEGMDFDEFIEELKKFVLLIGYHPKTVEEYFPEV